MTEPVRTEGFNVPGAGSVIDGGKPNLPPLNPLPGFVPQPAPAPVAEAAPAPAQPVPAADGLQAAIAALAAALPKPAEPVPAPAGEESLNNFDASTLEDPVLRSMATVMQTVGKGLDMDRVLAKAIETGNPEFIDVAYLKEKGGENANELITIAQGIVKSVGERAQSIATSIHSLAGGEANWNASTGVFNQRAPVELRTVVATMLDSGKENLITAAAKMVVEFSKGSGFVPNVQPTLESGFASVPAAQALSKDEFQAELRKLNPNDRNYIAVRGELFARRNMGKQLGK